MPRRRTDRRYGLFLAIALVPSTLAIPEGPSETPGASAPAALAIPPAPADTLEPQLVEHPNVARRLRSEIERIARDSLDGFHLEGWPGAEISRGSPALRSFALYDLDLDGRLEAVGRMGFVMEHDATDPAVTDPFVETFDVAFTIWVSEGSGRKLLLLLAESQVVPGGSWGEGLELVEVMDLTGDGRAELFYELSGWEGNDYLIYGYDRESGGPSLRRIFQGSGYSC